MPVHAKDGRIILELAAARPAYGTDQVLNGLPRMHAGALGNERREIHVGGIAV